MHILEGLYYISGLLIAAGLVFAYKQMKAANTNIELTAKQIDLLKKDMRDRNKRASVEKGLEYLQMFAVDIIPSISEYERRVDKALKGERRSRVSNKKCHFDIVIEELEEHEIREVITKQDAGLIHILNRLEMFSAGVLNGLTDENLVYTPISGMFCNFIQREHIYITILRDAGVPYKNLVELYDKWYDKSELDKLTLQKEELEYKIKKKEETLNKSNKLIGV